MCFLQVSRLPADQKRSVPRSSPLQNVWRSLIGSLHLTR